MTSTPPASGPGPLVDITVVTLEHAIAAPLCTRQLADLGARVIKIERPGSGDFARAYDDRVRGQSSHFIWTNRSKESLTLDLKHCKAAAILDRILANADVLVQNLAPGSAAKMGLSFQSLEEKYPSLIVCDISGFGDSGPYQHKKAYDLLIQSEAGLLSVTGSESEMSKAGISIADISAGTQAYSSILAAIIQRGKTGKGSHIDISMLECMVEWMGHPLYYASDGAPPPTRSGADHATIYPYGAFPTGDGKTLMIGLQNEREWLIFCDRVLQQPELARDSRFSSTALRSSARVELKAIIVEEFSTLSAEEIIARLEVANIAYARVNTMTDVWQHSQLQSRKRWVDVETPRGIVPGFLPPGNNNTYDPRMDGVPALGQHSDSILKEIGYGDEEIDELRTQKVI